MDHFQDYKDHMIECDLNGVWSVFPRHMASIFRSIGALDQVMDRWVLLASLLLMRRDLCQVLQEFLNNLEVSWFSEGGPALDLRVDQPLAMNLVRLVADLWVNGACLINRKPRRFSDGRIFDRIVVHGCQLISKFIEHVLKRIMLVGVELGWAERIQGFIRQDLQLIF